jgi:hypothetical protein
MPCVLWGVACFSLPAPTTAAEVVQEFCESLALGKELQCEDASLPRVDLYRMVPLVDGTLNSEDCVVAHLPDSSFGCAEMEEVYRQRDEAELRYSQARDALMALSESQSDCMEEFDPSSTCTDVAQVREEALAVLQHENGALRQKLQQSELINQQLQEVTALLQKEFSSLAQEVQPAHGGLGVAAAPAALSPRTMRSSSPSAPVRSSTGPMMTVRCGAMAAGCDSPLHARTFAQSPSWGGIVRMESKAYAAAPLSPSKLHRLGYPVALTARGPVNGHGVAEGVAAASPSAAACSALAAATAAMALVAPTVASATVGSPVMSAVAPRAAHTPATSQPPMTARYPPARIPQLAMRTWVTKDAGAGPQVLSPTQAQVSAPCSARRHVSPQNGGVVLPPRTLMFN